MDGFLSTRFAKYDSVSRQFHKFFSQDELSLTLDRKASLQRVNQLDSVKANKEDVQFTKKLIESLNERVKYLSIVQHELA